MARFAHGVMLTVSSKRWGCHSARFRRRTKQKDVAVLGFRNQPRTFVVELFLWLEGLLNMAWSMDLFGVFGSVFWLYFNSWVACAPAQTPPFVLPIEWWMQRYCPIPVVDFPFTSINFQIICRFRRISGVKLRRNQVALLMFAKCLHSASAYAFSEGVALCRPPRSLVS